MKKFTPANVFEYIKEKLSPVFTKLSDSVYEKNCRKRLKNENFSIICSNCIGGVIYHRLGKQFASPTVNLWFNQKEFLKFISNLPYYLSLEPVFVESKYSYPVAELDDVKVYFNHYHSQEEARESWNKRKARVDYDNIYIIMYERDGVTKEDIKSLSNIKCKNIIVLSENEYDDIKYVKKIKPCKKKRVNGEVYLDKDFFGKRTFEKQFDFVEFLNCENSKN